MINGTYNILTVGSQSAPLKLLHPSSPFYCGQHSACRISSAQGM